MLFVCNGRIPKENPPVESLMITKAIGIPSFGVKFEAELLMSIS